MESNAKSRTIMLALSGVLFGATAFGWWAHEQSKSTAGAQSKPVTVATTAGEQGVQGTTIASINSGSTLNSAIDAGQLSQTTTTAPAVGSVYPSTPMERAIQEARASIRRQPTEPVGLPGISRHSENRTPSVTRSAYSRKQITVPPPPPEWAPSIVERLPEPQTNVMAKAPSPRRLQVDDVRLVGLIDGKAIFRLNRRTSEELALPSSFTLGKGERFADIRLEAVDKEVATVRDDNKVATKFLDQVH